jgi:hypothetical protein
VGVLHRKINDEPGKVDLKEEDFGRSSVVFNAFELGCLVLALFLFLALVLWHLVPVWVSRLCGFSIAF